MSAHTPGPWHVIPVYTSAPEGVQNSDGVVIADVFCPKGFNPLTVMAEVKANAALIAAAPDLLAACGKAYAVLCKMNPNDIGPGSLELVKELLNAMARAEGERP